MVVIRSKYLFFHFIFINTLTQESFAAVQKKSILPHVPITKGHANLLQEQLGKNTKIVKRALNEDFKDKLETNLSFIEENLETTNKYRKLHGVPPLELDYKLCYECETFAKTLANNSRAANKIVLEHGHVYKVGENVMGTYSLKTAGGKFVADHWYSEIKKHNWTNNFFNYKSAHFTQLIWKDTKKFGIARVILPSTGKNIKTIIIIVARYIPTGNWAYRESFKKNVFPPVGQAQADKTDSTSTTSTPDKATTESASSS